MKIAGLSGCSSSPCHPDPYLRCYEAQKRKLDPPERRRTERISAMSTGHVIRKERNGKVRYYAVVEQDPEPDGRRVRKSHGGFDRKKDAREALNTILERQKEGLYVTPSRQTVGQFLNDEWLPGIRATVKPSTWDSYRRNVQLHVIPNVGSIALSKLGPAQLNDLYASLAEGAKPLGSRTVRYIHSIMSRALKDATRWGKVSRSVAALADPPRPKAPTDFSIWTPEQVRTFLASSKEDRLHTLYFLALTTGMRRGELLGLRWSDVDFAANRLVVRQTIVSIGYRVEISEPKTTRSKRTISLDPATVATLKAHWSRQLEERLAWGPAWHESGLVFTKEDGTLIHPQSASDAFQRAVKRAGLPKVRFHDMRHSYATLALDAGMKPWDLSDRLGHASVAFTLQAYRHAVQSTQETAARTAAAFIVGGF